MCNRLAGTHFPGTALIARPSLHSTHNSQCHYWVYSLCLSVCMVKSSLRIVSAQHLLRWLPFWQRNIGLFQEGKEDVSLRSGSITPMLKAPHTKLTRGLSVISGTWRPIWPQHTTTSWDRPTSRLPDWGITGRYSSLTASCPRHAPLKCKVSPPWSQSFGIHAGIILAYHSTFIKAVRKQTGVVARSSTLYLCIRPCPIKLKVAPFSQLGSIQKQKMAAGIEAGMKAEDLQS